MTHEIHTFKFPAFSSFSSSLEVCLAISPITIFSPRKILNSDPFYNQLTLLRRTFFQVVLCEIIITHNKHPMTPKLVTKTKANLIYSNFKKINNCLMRNSAGKMQKLQNPILLPSYKSTASQHGFLLYHAVNSLQTVFM